MRRRDAGAHTDPRQTPKRTRRPAGTQSPKLRQVWAERTSRASVLPFIRCTQLYSATSRTSCGVQIVRWLHTTRNLKGGTGKETETGGPRGCAGGQRTCTAPPGSGIPSRCPPCPQVGLEDSARDAAAARGIPPRQGITSGVQRVSDLIDGRPLPNIHCLPPIAAHRVLRRHCVEPLKTRLTFWECEKRSEKFRTHQTLSY